jgi:hypothetical protein
MAERPEKWDISTILSGWDSGLKTVPPVKEENMNEFLQLIMDLESSGGKDTYQKGGDPTNRGAGLYQLETGPHQGGMTRLTRAYMNLPKELTPKALARHYEEAVENDSIYDVKARLYPHQQSFLMAANIMLQAGGRKQYDKWVASGKSKEKFLDWWLDKHWAGWKTDKEREEKKSWAKKKLGMDITDEVLELENKENFLKESD